MIEFFEGLRANFLEYAAALGLSWLTIKGIWESSKTIFYKLFLKKKAELKEKLKNEQNNAEIVAAVFDKVVGYLTPQNAELKAALGQLFEFVKTNTNIPIELQSYITAILNTDGNEQLALDYENIKAELIANANNTIVETLVENKETVNEVANKVENAGDSFETAVTNTNKNVKKATKKIKQVANKINDEDVEYND